MFKIYSKKQIKSVWRDELVPQGDYLISMNLCFTLLLRDPYSILNQWKRDILINLPPMIHERIDSGLFRFM